MTPPALAIVRAAQDAVEQRFVRKGGVVGCEFNDFFGGRWQTQEIVVDAANQCATFGWRVGTYLSRFQCRQNEPVDGRRNPTYIVYRGRIDCAQTLIRP